MLFREMQNLENLFRYKKSPVELTEILATQ